MGTRRCGVSLTDPETCPKWRNPKANSAPSNACLAEDSSPMCTNTSARAALCSKLSPISTPASRNNGRLSVARSPGQNEASQSPLTKDSNRLINLEWALLLRGEEREEKVAGLQHAFTRKKTRTVLYLPGRRSIQEGQPRPLILTFFREGPSPSPDTLLPHFDKPLLFLTNLKIQGPVQLANPSFLELGQFDSGQFDWLQPCTPEFGHTNFCQAMFNELQTCTCVVLALQTTPSSPLCLCSKKKRTWPKPLVFGRRERLLRRCCQLEAVTSIV